jgi:hypothetical protein
MSHVDPTPSPAETSSDPKEEAAPPLNRAQRRAQEQGKKITANSSGLRPSQKLNGFNTHAKGGGKTRFPRTGHK